MFKKKKELVLNSLVSLLCILLPYFIFGGKLFIGGDDTRLYYIYPLEWINNISIASWFHFSTSGSNNPNQFIIPLLLLINILILIIKSRIIVNYLFFSLPLILGFIIFQKLLYELIPEKKYKLEIFIASLFYIFSPILAINQLSIFLYSTWLIGGIPLLILLLIRYVKTGSRFLLLISSLVFIFFAILFASIPWFLGFCLSALIPLIFIFRLLRRKKAVKYLTRAVIFTTAIIFTQFFWIIPFSLNFLIVHKGTFSSVILSKGSVDTFAPTVIATATGNILYPLLSLFHRGIAFDYNWQLKQTYLSFYDKYWYLNLIFIIVISFGFFNYSRTLHSRYKTFYLYSLLAFVFSLFFFTVNIDVLKNAFLLFGKLPGFVMFRNFYDKFAFGFVFEYSLLFCLSLIIFNSKFEKVKKITNILLIGIIFLNILPIKNIINKPLWQTKDIYTVANIPNEYENFMLQIKNNITSSSSILSLPYNIAAYGFIRDGSSNNIFIGTSPVGIFTGVNDFSGELSFSGTDSAVFKNNLLSNNYNGINEILQKYAINYIFITNNIPDQVKKSYLFEQKILNAQDTSFLSSISGKLFFSSPTGAYQIYQAKNQTPLISGNNVTFRKLSQVKYEIVIKNLKQNQSIDFRDTYNYDWKLFPERNTNSCNSTYYYASFSTAECAKFQSFNLNELKYLLKWHLPDSYHTQIKDFGNRWTIDYFYIKSHINPSVYTLNKDGSINVSFILYFVPQTYFYIGTLISIISILFIGCYVVIDLRKEKRKD